MRITTHGAVLDEHEDAELRKVIDRRWYTYGPACQEFERKLEAYTWRNDAILVNSGSSANLLALACLADDSLGERKIEPGDEVITAALGFPTTLNPILQIGAVPVFVDVDLPGMTPDFEQIKAAITKWTKAVVVAHPLGMPVNMPKIAQLCKDHGLWLVEDCCDSLGSPLTHQFSDISTLSFFPAHQITTGEGGAVLVDNPRLAKIIRSLRDWGRDCWCEPGQDNTCGTRFEGEYDHKCTYSRVGYHLAMTEMQAAIGVAQMDKLPGFVEARKNNHAYLHAQMSAAGMDKFFLLPPDVEASWFGFALICNHVTRNLITQFLEDKGIQTRVVFGGNLIRQPAYKGMLNPMWYTAELPNTDLVHNNGFWVGCWPGLKQAQLDYIVNSIVEYCGGGL